ncbi:unnamed protein product [Bursaphelenchus xylophilus]|uniref:(pine wood nematode) hypothetical protein n=1 Tax=Bursaphelenchus xylophilus TaxID=6326 RepID=A0A811K4R7_BURXY|nr:unnamed protein product [Bursaphelenchus xylophilus]CAG9086347.1 unnamed protein product [Bursaphelenchus xylophilus]
MSQVAAAMPTYLRGPGPSPTRERSRSRSVARGQGVGILYARNWGKVQKRGRVLPQRPEPTPLQLGPSRSNQFSNPPQPDPPRSNQVPEPPPQEDQDMDDGLVDELLGELTSEDLEELMASTSIGSKNDVLSKVITQCKELVNNLKLPLSERKRTANTSVSRGVINSEIRRFPEKIAREAGIRDRPVGQIAKNQLKVSPHKV